MVISISLSLLFVIIWSLFLNSSAFYYAIVFTVLVLIVTFNLVFTSALSGIISLVFIVVYVGAIIIMVGYVCSVVPNPNLTNTLEYNALIIILGLLIILVYIWFKGVNLFIFNIVNISVPFLSEFYYSVSGYYFFVLVVLLLLLLLFIVSTSVSINSTLRGV